MRNNMMIDEKFYENLENEFNVIYPKQDGATYSSLLNYSEEGKKYRQRWYRYKEGYSIDLIKTLISTYNKKQNGIILDPFLGSGTTIMAANELGLKAIGFEVNPFSQFLSKTKLTNYSLKDKHLFNEVYPLILTEAILLSNRQKFELPKLSIAHKVFDENIQNYILAIRHLIKNYNVNEKVRDLLFLGWLSAIEPCSLYKKAGNGLKRKVESKKNITTIPQVIDILTNIYLLMSEDLSAKLVFNSSVICDSALNIPKYIAKNTISSVIFSPPYANAFDYTEIYKLELWFGEFVRDYDDLKKLRASSLRSHLNGLSSQLDISQLNLIELYELNVLLQALENKKLWDKKIPIMLKLYFSQLFELLEHIFDVLENDGYCGIVVGNSSYGGVVFPTDLLVAKYAKTIGFKVDKIEVDRYIITSSQQYHQTYNAKGYLRESVICMKKSV